MLGPTFSAPEISLTLCLSLHSLLLQSLKSARGESLGPSQVLPEYTNNAEHAYGLLDSQEYIRELFKISFPSFILKGFFG